MSIERVNIQTPNFSLRATHIRGGQLQTILSSLRNAGADTRGDAPSARLGVNPTGPGAIQSPAERFPQLQSPTSTGRTPVTGGASPTSPSDAGSSPDPASGFASGGAGDMRSLDSNQMMRTIVQLLERLLQAIFQMLGQQGGAGDGAGQGGGCGAGSGGAAACGDGGGMPSQTSDPTASDPTTSSPSDPTTSDPAPGGPTNCGTGGGSSTAPTGGASTPPRNGHSCSPRHTGRSRARPRHRFGGIRRALNALGKGASAAAPLVPGGSAVRAGATAASHLFGGGRNDGSVVDRSGSRPYSANGGATPTKPYNLASQSTSSSSSSSPLGGGTFEDRLFAYLGSLVKQAENDLDGAMQQGQAGGGKGDSQTLASQRVQQLVQKRSELVETLTNTMKTFHQSTEAVTNNLK